MKTTRNAGLAIAALCLLPSAQAQVENSGDELENSDIEVVLVTGVRIHDQMVLEPSQVAHTGLDNSDIMRMFPGGNRNANGPLTRISQYRGLFGAQNTVSVDGAGYSADCPNWMDSPLSSIPQALTESVTLYRGLGSVETVREGLGGAIEIRSRSGDFADTDGWSAYGSAAVGYGENADAFNGSLLAGLHDAANWLNVAASLDRGDDYAFDGGTVAATEYDRAQYRFGYGRRIGDGEATLRASVNRTGESGTPALPMDMRYLDSEQYAVEWTGPLGAGSLHLAASTLSVEHVMDNFTLRPPPVNKMGQPMFRESAPLGDTDQFEASWRVTRDHPVELKPAILPDRPATGARLGLAVDLGTTTVVLRLEDLETGRRLATRSFENPQRFAGSDVMARIRYDGEHLFVAPRRYFHCCFILEDAGAPEIEPPPIPERSIRILETDPANGDAQLAGTIPLEDNVSVQGMYVNEDKLFALTGTSLYGTYGDFWADIAIWAPERLGFRIYDVADAANPTLDIDVKIDGVFVESRRIGNTVYLVSRYTPRVEGLHYYVTDAAQQAQNEALLASVSLDDLLPKITINDATLARVTLSRNTR